MIRRNRATSPIAQYEVQTAGGRLVLRPSELCALAETMEAWFAAHRDQLVDDLAEERFAQTRRPPRSIPWPSVATASH